MEIVIAIVDCGERASILVLAFGKVNFKAEGACDRYNAILDTELGSVSILCCCHIMYEHSQESKLGQRALGVALNLVDRHALLPLQRLAVSLRAPAFGNIGFCSLQFACCEKQYIV